MPMQPLLFRGLILTCAWVCVWPQVIAQDTTVSNNSPGLDRKNLVYGQGFGDVILFGVNYERVLYGRSAFHHNARCALGIFGDYGVALIGGQVILGARDLRVELGSSCGIVNDGSGPFITGNAGVRYKRRSTDGIFFRLAFNPVIYSKDGVSLLPIAFGVGTDF